MPSITEQDAGLLHLIERVVGPLLIAATIGLAGWMNSISAVQAELQEKHVTLENDRSEQKVSNSSFERKLEQVVSTQRVIEKQVLKVQTTQEINSRQFSKDIQEIKQLIQNLPQNGRND